MVTESKRRLESELAKVQGELIVFRDEYLPVLLGIPRLEAMPQRITTSNRLSSWQQAAQKPADWLPIPGSSTPPNAEEFQNFMFQEAKPAFSQSAGGASENSGGNFLQAMPWGGLREFDDELPTAYRDLEQPHHWPDVDRV